MGSLRSGVALLALSAAVAGCASRAAGQPAASPHTTTPAVPVSVRVILPSRTMTTGSQMIGHVVVDNSTGHAIHESGCHLLFTVALTSSSYHPDVTSETCAQLLTIPVGRSSYSVKILASYLACSVSAAQGGLPACLPGGQKMPPLPPGHYDAKVFFQTRQFAPTPPAIPVRVTAH